MSPVRPGGARYLGLIPRGASKYSWLTLLNTWITWALNVMAFAMIYVIGAKIISTYHLSAATWGWLVAGYLLFRVLIDIPANVLSDRLGSGWRRKYLWFPIMLEYSVVGALIAVPELTSSVWAYFGLLLGIALGTTASEAIGVTATTEWWAKEERGFAIGLHHTGYPIGALVGGLFSAWVMSQFGAGNWRLVYLISLATIPFAIWYWFLSSRRNVNAVYQRIDQRGLHRPMVTGHGSTADWRGWIQVLRIREVIVSAICLFLFQATYNLFATSYPEYLAFIHGYSYASVASLTVVWAFTGALFQFVWPSLSDRIGRKWIIVALGLWQAAVLALLPVSTSLVMVILVQLLYGMTVNAVFPTLFATSADVAPPDRTGAALGVNFAATWLGAAAGSAGAGQILQLVGGGFHSAAAYWVVFYLMVALSALAAVIRLFGRETNPRAGRRSPGAASVDTAEARR